MQKAEAARNTFVYDSAKRSTPALEELKEIFRYRHLIIQLTRRDVLTRYKRSILGVIWTMLNPLGTMIVLTIAFSHIFKFSDTQSYTAYVLSGILSWNFFAQTTTASMVNLVWGGGLLHRIYIPRTSFAIAAIATGIVNFGLSLIPLILVMLFTGVRLSPTILLLPFSVLFLALFALGMGLFISTLAVYFPDVAEMYQIVLTAWMYLTPIIYPEQVLPAHYKVWITLFNPMHHLVHLFRTVVLYGQMPTMSEFMIPAVISIGSVIVGWIIFTKKADEFSYRV